MRRYVKAAFAAFLGGLMFMTGCGSTGGNEVSEKTSGESAVTSAKTDTAPPETSVTPAVTSFKSPEEYGKVIALTFDDGPDAVSTNMILDVFEENNARASFFLIGDNIDYSTEETVKREAALGFEVNSHSRTHSYMDKMTAEEIKAEMDYTDEKIKSLTGVTPRFFRPPYIAVNDTMFEAIDKPFINGLGCNDWDKSVSAETIAEKVLAQAEDGAIILLHDGGSNFRTAEAIKTIVPELQKQGYELVTVSELFHAKGIEPQEDGILYSRAEQTSMY